MTDVLGGDVLREAEKRATQADRERRIKNEVTRISRMLNKGGIDPERKKGVTRLIASAAFLAVALADLEDEMKRDGYSSEYQNGENQWGTKQSPAVQSHSTFMQRYLSAMKQLIDLLPETEGGKSKKDEDELMGFIQSGR